MHLQKSNFLCLIRLIRFSNFKLHLRRQSFVISSFNLSKTNAIKRGHIMLFVFFDCLEAYDKITILVIT